MSVDEEFEVFKLTVPLPEEMINAQIVVMEKIHRMQGASPSRLSGLNVGNQELRERFRVHIINALRGFIYSVGNAFVFLQKEKKATAKGVCRMLTAQKSFLPEVSNAILPHRFWPPAEPDIFLAYACEWYMRGVSLAPQYFRSKEWELFVDDTGELGIRLTGEWEEKPPRPKRERAKVVRLKMGYREDDPPKK